MSASFLGYLVFEVGKMRDTVWPKSLPGFALENNYIGVTKAWKSEWYQSNW